MQPPTTAPGLTVEVSIQGLVKTLFSTSGNYPLPPGHYYGCKSPLCGEKCLFETVNDWSRHVQDVHAMKWSCSCGKTFDQFQAIRNHVWGSATGGHKSGGLGETPKVVKLLFVPQEPKEDKGKDGSVVGDNDRLERVFAFEKAESVFGASTDERGIPGRLYAPSKAYAASEVGTIIPSVKPNSIAVKELRFKASKARLEAEMFDLEADKLQLQMDA